MLQQDLLYDRIEGVVPQASLLKRAQLIERSFHKLIRLTVVSARRGTGHHMARHMPPCRTVPVVEAEAQCAACVFAHGLINYLKWCIRQRPRWK